MEHIQPFAASEPKLLSKCWRCTWLAGLPLLVVVALVGIASAQSKDQDHPTPVTSNVIPGVPISPDSAGLNYYYSFVADPGDVTITLTAEASSDIVQVGFDLLDEKEVQLVHAAATTGSNGTYTTTGQGVRTVTVKRRQRMLLRISIQAAGFGKYRVRLSGAVDFRQDAQASRDKTDDSAASPCFEIRRDVFTDKAEGLAPKYFPKKGTLVVRMKDGSTKTIDLSQAESVFISTEP